jgi:hypothetical protein
MDSVDEVTEEVFRKLSREEQMEHLVRRKSGDGVPQERRIAR